MDSFAETQRFTICNQAGYSGGPEYKTEIHVLGSGHERRNVQWATTRGRWDAGDKNVSESDKNEMLAFFRARQGKAQGFRFRDWTDYSATDAAMQAIDSTTAQLVKVYEPGSHQQVREITKPVDAITIKVNGSPYADFTVDYTTGIVTWTATPPDLMSDVVAWSGEFDIPARFDTDTFMASPYFIDGERSQYRIDSLPIVEIRV